MEKNLLEQIATCVERGKVNAKSPFPPDMKGQDGAVELTARAIDSGYSASAIMNEALLAAMQVVGEKFRDNRIFVPEVLISAKAMKGAMDLLKPYFISGEVKHKGTVVLGTVSGDLHDIGKNIVSMVLQGGGWNVIDLGIDVNADKFIIALNENNARFVGMSALLTTTMQNMGPIAGRIKQELPEAKILVGGAPLSANFAKQINADNYSPDPQGALDYLNSFA